MPKLLIVFSDPRDSMAVLTLDNGQVLNGTTATHPTGRAGIGFTIPDGTPQGNGCKIELTHPTKIKISQRAILYLNDGILRYPWGLGQEAALASDDFYLQDKPSIVLLPPMLVTPLDIIRRVYAEGDFDLSTKDGCGQFTEACCTALHNERSATYGHIRKFGAQNQYNGHSVDSVQSLKKDGPYPAAIYDIILNAEVPEAEPAFNYIAPPAVDLWYYPA